MTPQAQAVHHVAAWVAQLAHLTRHSEPPSRDALATYAATLVAEFPAGAFTTDSLTRVAEEHEFFPPFKALRKCLSEWWQTRRPQQQARIAGPESADDLDAMDRFWIDFYWRKNADGFCDCGSNGCARTREHALSLIRSRSPKAYAKLAPPLVAQGLHDTRAYLKAVEREWLSDEKRTAIIAEYQPALTEIMAEARDANDRMRRGTLAPRPSAVVSEEALAELYRTQGVRNPRSVR